MSNLDFIIAKVKGMRGKLYEGDRLLPLCDTPTIEDLAARLAPGKPIGDTAGLQRYLTVQHVAALHRILTSLDGWEAEMFLWMLRHYQAENLKVIIRAWATKAGSQAISAYTVALPEPLDLPADAMIKSPSMEALILSIPVKQFRDGALQGLGDFEESGRPFFMEAGIDKAYFTELQYLAGRGRASARTAVLKLVGIEIDIHNTMTILRAVFNYSVLFNKIRPFLAPPGGAVGPRVMDQIRKAPDIDAAAANVPITLIGGERRPLSGDDVELAMWSTLHKTANRQYYTSVLDFGAIAAFYYIKRVELANLITISECHRNGQRRDPARQKLMTLPTAEPAGAH